MLWKWKSETSQKVRGSFDFDEFGSKIKNKKILWCVRELLAAFMTVAGSFIFFCLF